MPIYIYNTINVEEDVTKSPSLSPSNSPHQITSSSSTVSKPAALSDSVGNNNAVVSDVKNTTKSAVEQESPSSMVLTNGKSGSGSPPRVNGGIAPVRHENGSNKNLTVEVDIPPGK